jgi:hypothetical protein
MDYDGFQGKVVIHYDWPFKDMLVGDDVLIRGIDGYFAQKYCHVYGRQAGKKFKTKKQDTGGIRIWRIK